MRKVAVSIQATGSSPFSGHRVIEIGCVELVDGQLTGGHYHSYLNPDRGIDQELIEEHGITEEFLEDKPRFKDIAGDLIEFIGDDQIITYRSDILCSFINSEVRISGLHFAHIGSDDPIVDVLQIAKDRHPGQSNSLAKLCERYYVSTSQEWLNGALYKAELIADIYIAFKSESTKKLVLDPGRFNESKNLIVADSFAEFDAFIDSIGRSAICRGVSNHEYPLLPSLFRHQDVEGSNAREGRLMWLFKTHAKPHLPNIPVRDIEWLTIAQHHGLPTRLLDWSLNPLVACYFAVQSMTKDDSAVYIYDVGKFVKEEDIDISKLDEITAFFPSHATRRVTAQSGAFTIHPTSQMQLESDSLLKVVIPSDKKRDFMEKLTKYGIHPGSMFPDLDGLANYLTYMNGYIR